MFNFLYYFIHSCHYDELGENEQNVTKITPGMTVAALDNRKWYRAEVLSDQSISLVKVRFVDFGNIKKIAPRNLKFLDKQFSVPAAKSGVAKLFGVVPEGAFWNTESVFRFIELTENKKIYATIKSVENGIYSLDMFYDFKNKISIADQLVAEGFAEKVPSGPESNMNAILCI